MFKSFAAVFQNNYGRVVYRQVTHLFFDGVYWWADFEDGTDTKTKAKLLEVRYD
mgnify:CR=1 FL=1